MIYYFRKKISKTILGLTLICLYLSACNNASGSPKNSVKEEKVFDYLGVGYNDWKNINGLFSFDGQDYSNKSYFLTRLKNGHVIISYRNKRIELKPHGRNIASNFFEETYGNDSIKLIISAKPSTEELTKETLVFGAKAQYYDAKVQLSVSGNFFFTKAFGAW